MIMSRKNAWGIKCRETESGIEGEKPLYVSTCIPSEGIAITDSVGGSENKVHKLSWKRFLPHKTWVHFEYAYATRTADVTSFLNWLLRIYYMRRVSSQSEEDMMYTYHRP